MILGWILTWAAVELGMLQRLLDTTSLTGRQWLLVLVLSLVAPAIVAADRIIQRRRTGTAGSGTTGSGSAGSAGSGSAGTARLRTAPTTQDHR